MDKKAHEALERIRKDVTLTTSDMENQDAAEFFNELADWAYANGEAMLIDDEPEKQDDYEDRAKPAVETKEVKADKSGVLYNTKG